MTWTPPPSDGDDASLGSSAGTSPLLPRAPGGSGGGIGRLPGGAPPSSAGSSPHCRPSPSGSGGGGGGGRRSRRLLTTALPFVLVVVAAGGLAALGASTFRSPPAVAGAAATDGGTDGGDAAVVAASSPSPRGRRRPWRRAAPPAPPAPVWTDVSVAAGIPPERALKYGGPLVADLDGDGWADAVLLNHHRSPTRVLWGGPGGALAPGPDLHAAASDVHGITAAVLPGGNGRMTVVVARGGGWGHSPQPPWVMRPTRERRWVHVEGRAGLSAAAGRGRSPRLLDPRGGGSPELLLINYRGRGVRKAGHDRQLLFTPAGSSRGGVGAAARRGAGPTWTRRRGSGIEAAAAEAAVVVTLPDGSPGLVTFPWFRLWATPANGSFTDVTARVMGSTGAAGRLSPVAGVAAVGWGRSGGARGDAPDLYLTRSAGRPDVLLRASRSGRYVDASAAAGVAAAMRGGARGVAVADFNNDGEEDVYVVATAYPRTADTLLLGTGPGRPFRVTRVAVKAPTIRGVDGLGGKRQPRGGAPGDAAPGDGVATLDADGDGRVDVLLGDGDQDNLARAGVWRLLRNTAPRRWGGRKGGGAPGGYLAVRVGHSPAGRASALGAVVHVAAAGGSGGGRSKARRVWWRRVGGGGPVFSQGVNELVHVGLGGVAAVDVTVRWSDGGVAKARGVPPSAVGGVLPLGRPRVVS